MFSPLRLMVPAGAGDWPTTLRSFFSGWSWLPTILGFGMRHLAFDRPEVFLEMRFSAPAGQYTVWLRGGTDVNSGYADAVWVQVGDQIGTATKCFRMGNWLDVHPAGVYGWAGDTDPPSPLR